MINIELIGFMLEIVGELMLALTFIMVHHRFRIEHKVDERVFRAMKREQMIGFIGVICIVVSFFLQLPAYL
jgi:peptidoglycan biosynthesis protein MviN/MurJ (putative lipid II flippase)